MSETEVTRGNANPARIGAVTLLCCEVEYEPKDYSSLRARILGDGSVCVTCPTCGRDLAVMEVS